MTFDANPKELASRDAGCTHVLVLWSRRTGRAAVVIEDDATGDVGEMDVGERENPLDVFDHPFVYAPERGHPGRAWSTNVGGPITAA